MLRSTQFPLKQKNAASYKCSTSINTFYLSLLRKQCTLQLQQAITLAYLARHFYSIQVDVSPIVKDGGNHMKFHYSSKNKSPSLHLRALTITAAPDYTENLTECKLKYTCNIQPLLVGEVLE